MFTLENKYETQKPTYIHVRGDAAAVTEAPQSGVCLYIGKNDAILSSLKDGYAACLRAETLEAAERLMPELGKLQGYATAIFIDLDFNYEQLYVFLSHKEKHLDLFAVPVVMNIENLTREEVSLLRKKKMVDELINFETELGMISEKVDFLHYIRKSIHSRSGKIKLEQKRNAVPSDAGKVKRFISLLFNLT
jgi:hypothetical protein